MKRKRGILLFVIALSLSVVTVPFGIGYSLVKQMRKRGKLDEHFLEAAIAIDQTGNVLMSDLFNELFIKKEGCQFGDKNETISSVLGKNQEKNTLTKAGALLAKGLDKIDKNHSLNSINPHLPCREKDK